MRNLCQIVPALLIIVSMSVPHPAMAQAAVQTPAPGDNCIIEVPSGSFVTGPFNVTYPDGTKHSYPRQPCENMVVPWTDYQYVDQVYSSNNPQFSSITAQWTVPNAPPNVNGQTIFIWDGLEKYDLSVLMQPVLAFGQASYKCQGLTCYVGGNYWYLASWIAYANKTAIVSTIIRVNPGDLITGTVTWNTGGCGTNSLYYWISARDNTLSSETDLQSCMSSQVTLGYSAVLEAWNINTCDQFPNQNQPQPHIDFTSISSTSTPSATWLGAFTPAQPQCGYNSVPMVQVHIHSYPTTDTFSRSHGLALDQQLPNPWWPPYQSGYEFLVTNAVFDYYTTYVFSQAGVSHYLKEAASGFCPSYCWYSQIYINGVLNAQANVDRSDPVQANFVDQWTPNVRLFF